MENGDIYVGSMKEGRMFDIQGKYKWVDGQIYEGQFRDGMPNGQGKETYPSGNSYIGDFVDGTYHGKGMFKWAEG